MIPTHSADWTDADVSPAFLHFCADVGIADFTTPLRVWAFESDNETTAHNPNGNASGLFQLMPKTAKGLGYPLSIDPDLAAYRKLSVTGQLAWATKYYGQYRGRVGTVARFYCATFMPALLEHADDPSFVLCGLNGPYAEDYAENEGFDTGKKGAITPADLVAATVRATGPRTLELIARVIAAAGNAATDPAPSA